MSIYNVVAGIWMIIVGVILDIYILFIRKKINAPWKILIIAKKEA